MIIPLLTQLKKQKISIISLHQIGINLPKKILSTKKKFMDCFKKSNSENFIIASTTLDRAYSRK